MYALSYHAGTVTPVATATNTAGKPVRTGQRPIAIVITPDGKQAYVACLGNLAGPGTVTPIATATSTAGKPIRVGAGPTALVIAR
jgi:DNA-binding beta-propeller fold protein YncE